MCTAIQSPGDVDAVIPGKATGVEDGLEAGKPVSTELLRRLA